MPFFILLETFILVPFYLFFIFFQFFVFDLKWPLWTPGSWSKSVIKVSLTLHHSGFITDEDEIDWESNFRCKACSSVASPICQEGQSERTFPIFAFSSQFFLFFLISPYFFPLFHDFFPLFPDFVPLIPDVFTLPNFWQNFRCQGVNSAPLTPLVTMPLKAIEHYNCIISLWNICAACIKKPCN